MKFVDEATVQVEAGCGGNGCASFRREKFVPRGGPDGGDGGHGGSVFLIAKSGLNTLAEFRVRRRFAAQSGRGGAGRQRTGASGEDLYVPVPAGTVVSDIDTDEILGDLAAAGQTLKVAQGGRGGLGNARFKSGGGGWNSSCWRTSAWSACPTPGNRRCCARFPPRAPRWPAMRSPRSIRIWAWSASRRTAVSSWRTFQA